MIGEMGEFALRQLISSLVIVGPLFIIIAAINFVFKQNKKMVLTYFLLGVFLTLVGAVSLYRQFSVQRNDMPMKPTPSPSMRSSPGKESMFKSKDSPTCCLHHRDQD